MPAVIALLLLIMLLIFIPPFNVMVVIAAAVLFSVTIFFALRNYISNIHAGYITLFLGTMLLLHLLQILTIFNAVLFSAFTISSYLVLFKKW